MKKIICCLLMLCMLFSFGFVGCSNNQRSSTSSQRAESDDSWRNKRWDSLNREEKEKVYDEVNNKVKKAGWAY